MSDISFERLKKALIYIKNHLIDSENNMYLKVGSVIDLNNIITGSNNFILRKANANPYGYEKMYMVRDSIEDKLCQLIDQFNKRKITHKDFHLQLLENIHPFYDGNGITCKILPYLQLGF